MSVTIKDIAQKVGVSYSTVSKALNDSPLVKENTKTKILKVAREMGYTPNFAAQRLVKKESKIIGLAWPTIERLAHSTLVSKINSQLAKHSYSMILSIDSIQISLDIFKRYQVDGAIVFDEENREKLHSFQSTFPIISYGVGGHEDFPIIDVNYREALYVAVQYLIQLGHRNIAFVGESASMDKRQLEKYVGFQHAMKYFGLETNDYNLINTDGLAWYDGYISAKKLLHSSHIPTAIIGSSYDISCGIVRALREANYNIPKDISVISYDNIPQMGNIEIPLTSVGVPIEMLADRIVETLLKAITNKNSVPLNQTLTPTITERNSCAKI